MAIPALVKSTGPASDAYYKEWNTFTPGYPKYKNLHEGVPYTNYANTTLIGYRQSHLYWTGLSIIERQIDFEIGSLPEVGEYYDIATDGYVESDNGINYDPGNSQKDAR